MVKKGKRQDAALALSMRTARFGGDPLGPGGEKKELAKTKEGKGFSKAKEFEQTRKCPNTKKEAGRLGRRGKDSV